MGKGGGDRKGMVGERVEKKGGGEGGPRIHLLKGEKRKDISIFFSHSPFVSLLLPFPHSSSSSYFLGSSFNPIPVFFSLSLFYASILPISSASRDKAFNLQI